VNVALLSKRKRFVLWAGLTTFFYLLIQTADGLLRAAMVPR